MKLWRAVPVARADFGPRTVWHTREEVARKVMATFGQAFADPIGLYVAEIEPEHVLTVPNGQAINSHRCMAYASELINQAAGHRWLALWDGPEPGGDRETWVHLGAEQIPVEPVPDPGQWTIPADWT